MRVIIIAGAVVVVLGPVAGRVCDEDGIPAISLPILVQRILKAPCNILWAVSTTCGIELAQEFLASDNIIAKAKDLRDKLSITVISIGNYRDANLDIEVLVADTINNCFYLLFASIDPLFH